MSIELSRNVIVGQYVPGASLIHRLDPRAKIICTLIIALTMSSVNRISIGSILVLLVIGLTLLARLPLLFVLRGLLPSLPFILFLFLMQVLFQGSVIPCETIYYEWWFIQLTPCILYIVALGVIRVISFLFLISLLTLTTSSSQLTYATESLLSPLKRIGMPVHEIALANMIGLRFVPTMVEELERIIKAQASRGGEIGTEKWYHPVGMVKSRLPLVVPLFVNSLRRGEDLILAMEARGYMGGKGRTRFVQFRSTQADWIAVSVTVLIYLGSLYLVGFLPV